MPAAASDVRNDTERSRFEISTEQGDAVLVYTLDGDRMTLVHTEVPEALEGQGYASTLVQAALASAKRDGLRIVPTCPYVSAWLERHPGTLDDEDRVR